MSEGRQDIGGGAALPAAAAAIAAGYTFTGPALDLGALLWEGTAHPGARVAVPLSVLNRHGLVAGATGTGKTKTLQVVAEQLSAQGVPVFLADVKGDLSGVSAPGAGGDRVQHALRAFTPDDAKALRATVSTFPRPAYDLGELLTGLGTGEAVVSVLGEDGAPTPVAATRLRAPESLMGPLDPAGLDSAVRGSGLYGRYAEAVDRESAYEKPAAASAAAEAVSRPPAAAPGGGRESGAAGRTTGGAAGKAAGGADDEESLVEQVVHSGMFKSLTRSVGTQVGREITRSLFGVRRR